MTPRERVRLALQHREPDRLPLDFGGTFLSSATPQMQQRIAEVLGLKGAPDPRFPEFDDRIQKALHCDLRSLNHAVWPSWRNDRLEFPLQGARTIEDLDNYAWPEPAAEMIAGAAQQARFLKNETDYFICAAQMGAGTFELGCYLRGYELTLLDIAGDKEFYHAFSRKCMETNTRLGEPYYGAVGPYVDMVLIGDDLATQNGPFCSPGLFREMIKPYFKQRVDLIKRCCPNAFIAHHCCGSSFLLLDDLAEIGVDVINPTQTTARQMNVENLVAKKNRLSFHGGGDLQHILPFGTRREVEDFTRHLIRHMAPGGGYILAPCHSLPDDVKPENLVIFLETAYQCGTYPMG